MICPTKNVLFKISFPFRKEIHTYVEFLQFTYCIPLKSYYYQQKIENNVKNIIRLPFESNIDLIFPRHCKSRIYFNIEANNSYEL